MSPILNPLRFPISENLFNLKIIFKEMMTLNLII